MGRGGKVRGLIDGWAEWRIWIVRLDGVRC